MDEQKWSKKVVFWSIKIGAQILDGKKRHKKELGTSGGRLEPCQGGWVGTMWTVGGRVREGNPPNFGLTWALWFKTPATGAVDLRSCACSRRGSWWSRQCSFALAFIAQTDMESL